MDFVRLMYISLVLPYNFFFADQGIIDKKTWLAFLSNLEEK